MHTEFHTRPRTFERTHMQLGALRRRLMIGCSRARQRFTENPFIRQKFCMKMLYTCTHTLTHTQIQAHVVGIPNLRQHCVASLGLRNPLSQVMCGCVQTTTLWSLESNHNTFGRRSPAGQPTQSCVFCSVLLHKHDMYMHMCGNAMKYWCGENENDGGRITGQMELCCSHESWSNWLLTYGKCCKTFDPNQNFHTNSLHSSSRRSIILLTIRQQSERSSNAHCASDAHTKWVRDWLGMGVIFFCTDTEHVWIVQVMMYLCRTCLSYSY